MAARRVSKSSLDWAAFAKKIPENQKTSFNAFKAKQDEHVRRIAALPENLPKIDWNAYKGRVANAMLDDFQKKYEALNVPFPKDTLSSQIDQQAATEKSNYEALVKNSNTKIESLKDEKSKWEAMMPVESMNMEEALTYIPDMKLTWDPNRIEEYPYHQPPVAEIRRRNHEELAAGHDDH